MKYRKRFITIIVLVIGLCLPLSNGQVHAATSLSYSQVKQYQPKSHSMNFTYQQTRKGKNKKANLTYSKALSGWVSSNDQAVPNLGYRVTHNMYYVGLPSSDAIFMLFKVPTKKGNVYKGKGYDGQLEDHTKILSTTQKVKIKAGTYKNCIVTRDEMSGATFYFAKNVGLILIKSNYSRIELIKVKK